MYSPGDRTIPGPGRGGGGGGGGGGGRILESTDESGIASDLSRPGTLQVLWFTRFPVRGRGFPQELRDPSSAQFLGHLGNPDLLLSMFGLPVPLHDRLRPLHERTISGITSTTKNICWSIRTIAEARPRGNADFLGNLFASARPGPDPRLRRRRRPAGGTAPRREVSPGRDVSTPRPATLRTADRSLRLHPQLRGPRALPRSGSHVGRHERLPGGVGPDHILDPPPARRHRQHRPQLVVRRGQNGHVSLYLPAQPGEARRALRLQARLVQRRPSISSFARSPISPSTSSNTNNKRRFRSSQFARPEYTNDPPEGHSTGTRFGILHCN